MAVANGDVVRVTCEFNLSTNDDVQNVWYIQNTGTPIDEADAIDDILEVLEALYALLATLIAITETFDRIRAVNTADNTDVGVGLPADTTPFTGSGSVLPRQCCLGLNLTTARLSSVGRKFFGIPITNSQAGLGTLVPSAILGLADVGDYVTVQQAATNSTWRFGIIASADGAFLPFESYSIPTTITTQRRRRQGVGE